MTALLAALLLARPATGAETARDKRKELSEVQRELEVKKREIEGFRRQEDSYRKDLSRLTGETADSSRRLGELEVLIRGAEAKKGAIKARLGAVQLAEGRWRSVLGSEFRDHARTVQSQFAFHGSAEVREESFRRAAIVEKVRYLEDLRGTRGRSESEQAEARRQAARLLAKGVGARQEHRTRESLLLRTREAFEDTRQKSEQARRRVRELQDSAMALTRLVRSLEKKTAYKAAGAPIPLAERPHSLPWPAEGRVVESFGKQRVESLNTWVVRQGIRLSTAKDAPVSAVQAGKVIFVGPFRSYGTVMIIDHGQAFFSIYGQLGVTLKAKGDLVSPREAIAAAGDSEDGGAVYLEFRQSGDALDPSAWLETR